MVDLRVATLTGPETTLPEAVVEEFKKSLRGELLRPSDETYDLVRQIHNGMIGRHPALIARCTGVADVINTINFARANNLLVSVRGGGHSVPGFAVCDGGIMIDLSRMNSVRVDPVGRTARVEGGATWGDFDHETHAFGLATTGGIARPTGIAGLTLGGGHGFLMRRFGLVCDNLLSADVVTGDGNFLTASATENPELFWGVRGGGGNFGVVTSFEFRLYELSQVLGGLIAYPMAQAKDLLKLYHEITSTAPDELGLYAVLATLPDGTKSAVILVCYSGPVEEGERVLEPLRAFGPPLMDQVMPMPYPALQSMAEDFNPAGVRNYWKSSYLRGLSEDAMDVMIEYFATSPHPLTHVVIEHHGGAISRVGEDAMACSYRRALYNFLIVGMWTNPEEDDTNTRWVRGLFSGILPFSSEGFYVNYDQDQAERVRAAYSPAKYDRLVALKNKYDPTNLFRLNQNIRPMV
jgi:FAD/FMN-containing dehydrogenase